LESFPYSTKKSVEFVIETDKSHVVIKFVSQTALQLRAEYLKFVGTDSSCDRFEPMKVLLSLFFSAIRQIASQVAGYG